MPSLFLSVPNKQDQQDSLFAGFDKHELQCVTAPVKHVNFTLPLSPQNQKVLPLLPCCLQIHPYFSPSFFLFLRLQY